jgi:hypothetical protein
MSNIREFLANSSPGPIADTGELDRVLGAGRVLVTSKGFNAVGPNR